MKREIKFRLWNECGDKSRMFYSVDEVMECLKQQIIFDYNPLKKNGYDHRGNGSEFMQYTGMKDKNGKDIYEGDIIRFREPYRTTQTHEGDNIPNGSYTEPMEPAIREIESQVIFKDGAFIIEFERGYDVEYQLAWTDRKWESDDIKEQIRVRSNDIFDWFNDPEEGDAVYLMQEYGLSSMEELEKYLSGNEIIGNIYEHPEILE